MLFTMRREREDFGPYHVVGHPLLAPLLPTEHESDLHATLLGLRHAAMASDQELLALVENAVEALADADQEAVLSAAARPHSEVRGALHALVADKRIANGDPAGDETLDSAMLVPLLRRASRLSCMDAELGERLLNAVGVLTASLAGHGEHTCRISLGGMRAPLALRHVPSGPSNGVRFWPVARLGVGVCAVGWAGLRIMGRTVLELGCGTAAVGLACAALGAREVWSTDVDADALALAARNVAANGATAVRVARLDMRDETDAARPEGMPRCFGLVVAAIVDDGDETSADALRAAARYVDLTDPLARVLCCFGQAKDSGQARRSEGAAEAAVRMGDLVLDCGLRVVASERVSTDAHGMSKGMLLLLLVPASHHEDGRAGGPCTASTYSKEKSSRRECQEEMPNLEEESSPYEVDASATVDWVAAAASSLVDNGACVLRRPVLIPAELVELCRADTRPRLDRLLGMAAEANAAFAMWSKESAPEAIRFRELYSRAPWECRFDVTVPHRLGSTTTVGIAAVEHVAASDGMDQVSSTAPWRALLEALDTIVRPVLAASALFGSDDEIEIDHVGFVLSEPGAPAQMWHPDCESRIGLVNAFVPLVPLTAANGPTALALCSHRPPLPCCPRVVRPLLAAGEVLLFDWRTWHRGCSNSSLADRPVAYVTYVRRGVERASYKRTLPSLEDRARHSAQHPAARGARG